MKKKILAFLFVAILTVTSFCLFSGSEFVIPKKKFYINSAAADALSTMTTVYKDSGGSYVMGRQYIEINAQSVPNKYSTANYMDAVILMVSKLEECVDLHLSGERSTIFNTVAGYIRSLNKNYQASGAFIPNTWQAVVGDFDWSIIQHTTSRTGNEISILEYFASFVSSANYNTNYDNFTSIPLDSYYVNKNVGALDPLSNDKLSKIDLTHMFASMDGIYDATGRSIFCSLFFGDKNMPKDLVSWLGDLQTYAEEISKLNPEAIAKLNEYDLSKGFIDFNTFNSDNGLVCSNFSAEDLRADIDAMNIIKLFYEGTENSLSEAMMAYYTVVQPDTASKGNRFDMFLSSVTMDLNGGAGYSDPKEMFINEICRPMNLEYKNGEFIEYTNSKSYVTKLLGDAKNNFAARRYATKLFCDYVMLNSHRYGA